ncbi:MAG: hypothetical protein GX621_11635 [Pirellulaceae bacterium]|nr:hypothetical protein [Pirellulaceae bacterium]
MDSPLLFKILLTWAGVLLIPLFLLIGRRGGRRQRRVARWSLLLGFALVVSASLGLAAVAARESQPEAASRPSFATNRLTAALPNLPMHDDAMVRFGCGFALLVGLGLAPLVARERRERKAIHWSSLAAAVAGLMLTAAAGNLVLLVVGLEMVAWATHAMLLAGHPDRLAAETRLRYVLLGVLASALWLYAMSFVYGMAGSTDLAAIRAALSAPNHSSVPIDLAALTGVAVVLLVAALGIKITAAPFCLHAAGVWQTTTHGDAAFLAVLPKAAATLVLLRLLTAIPGGAIDASRLTAVLAVASMTYGNLMAIRQTNLRRWLAHVSIAETGFLLLAVSAALTAACRPVPTIASAAVLLQLAVSSVALLGTCAVLSRLESLEFPMDDVEQLAGLRRTHPALAAALAVFLLSLMGVPPLAGFWAKLTILAGPFDVAAADTAIVAATNAAADTAASTATEFSQVWPIGLAIVAGANLLIAAVYYVRLLDVIYFRLPLAMLRGQRSRAIGAVVTVCVILIVAVGLVLACSIAAPGCEAL